MLNHDVAIMATRTLLSMRAAAPECQYRASVRSDSLAERSGFELPVPLVTYRNRGLSASFVFSVGADQR